MHCIIPTYRVYGLYDTVHVQLYKAPDPIPPPCITMTWSDTGLSIIVPWTIPEYTAHIYLTS